MAGKEGQQPGKYIAQKKNKTDKFHMPNLGRSIITVLLEQARGQHAWQACSNQDYQQEQRPCPLWNLDQEFLPDMRVTAGCLCFSVIPSCLSWHVAAEKNRTQNRTPHMFFQFTFNKEHRPQLVICKPDGAAANTPRSQKSTISKMPIGNYAYKGFVNICHQSNNAVIQCSSGRTPNWRLFPYQQVRNAAFF